MRLPAFEDLSKEQDLIYGLDLDGNYLVSGPPGTGKSVMALYRAQALTFDDRIPAVLMYSKVLRQYTQQAAGTLKVAGHVTTFHSWFWALWRRHYRTPPPTIEGHSYEPDWAEVARIFLTDPPPLGELADLIVDEGQDLALGFFRITRFTARNITVFADENQQLHDHNTTLREIQTAIGAAEHLQLRRNYRNTAQIAAVAARYYTGTPTGIPEPPQREGDRPTLRRHDGIPELIDLVARYTKVRTNLAIGIACPNRATQSRLYRELSRRDLPLRVQQYDSGDKTHQRLDFESHAVTLVNYRSLKGLEFDTLFVPELQQIRADATSASTRMMFYVITSRARDELHLSWCGPQSRPDILEGLEGLVQEL